MSVAAYNSLLLWVTPSAPRVRRSLLGLVILDALSFFVPVTIQAEREPVEIYASFVWVLLEAMLGAGVAAGWIMIMAVTSGCLVMAQRMLARRSWERGDGGGQAWRVDEPWDPSVCRMVSLSAPGC